MTARVPPGRRARQRASRTPRPPSLRWLLIALVLTGAGLAVSPAAHAQEGRGDVQVAVRRHAVPGRAAWLRGDRPRRLVALGTGRRPGARGPRRRTPRLARERAGRRGRRGYRRGLAAGPPRIRARGRRRGAPAGLRWHRAGRTDRLQDASGPRRVRHRLSLPGTRLCGHGGRFPGRTGAAPGAGGGAGLQFRHPGPQQNRPRLDAGPCPGRSRRGGPGQPSSPKPWPRRTCPVPWSRSCRTVASSTSAPSA